MNNKFDGAKTPCPKEITAVAETPNDHNKKHVSTLSVETKTHRPILIDEQRKVKSSTTSDDWADTS